MGEIRELTAKRSIFEYGGEDDLKVPYWFDNGWGASCPNVEFVS